MLDTVHDVTWIDRDKMNRLKTDQSELAREHESFPFLESAKGYARNLILDGKSINEEVVVRVLKKDPDYGNYLVEIDRMVVRRDPDGAMTWE